MGAVDDVAGTELAMELGEGGAGAATLAIVFGRGASPPGACGPGTRDLSPAHAARVTAKPNSVWSRILFTIFRVRTVAHRVCPHAGQNLLLVVRNVSFSFVSRRRTDKIRTQFQRTS